MLGCVSVAAGNLSDKLVLFLFAVIRVSMGDVSRDFRNWELMNASLSSVDA